MVLKIRTTDKELNLTQEDRPQTVLIFQIELLYAITIIASMSISVKPFDEFHASAKLSSCLFFQSIGQ